MQTEKAIKAGYPTKPAAILALCLGAATLFDFYVGIRVFDFVALGFLGLLAAMMFWKMEKHPAGLALWLKGGMQSRLASYAPALIFSLAVLWGWWTFRHNSSLMMLFLLAVGCWASTLPPFIARLVMAWVPRLILFHLVLMGLQLLAYYTVGFKLDYLSIIRDLLHASPLYGVVPDAWLNLPESRMAQHAADRTHLLFRPTGLFQEPNNYSESMMLLLLMIIKDKRLAWLRYLTYASIALSQSMYGIAVVGVLFLFDNVINDRKRHLAILALAILLPISISISFGNNVKIEPVGRALHLFSDTSFAERYVGLHLAKDLGLIGDRAVKDHCDMEPLPFKALGHGISSRYFEYCTAKNGFAQAIYGLGVFFLLVVPFFLWNLGRSRTKQDAQIIALGTGLMLLSYPFYTYVLFWLWLGLMLAATRRAKA